MDLHDRLTIARASCWRGSQSTDQCLSETHQRNREANGYAHRVGRRPGEATPLPQIRVRSTPDSSHDRDGSEHLTHAPQQVSLLHALALAPTINLADALAVVAAKREGIEYGRARGAGSAAFIVGSIAAGFTASASD
jgi:hypothetical protein